MRARDHEGWARYGANHAKPFADTARQGGLAGTERPGEQHEVSGIQKVGERNAEPMHNFFINNSQAGQTSG
jgi:hypothetical protein